MTQKEFIQKFKAICKKNNTTGVNFEDWHNFIQMCYVNHQDDEIVNDEVSVVGFDDEGDFYIDFLDTNCTAYEEDMEDCNCEDAWEFLWSEILDYFDSDDFEASHNFKAGDAVYWNDPAIDDYPEEEREEALKRRFVVFDVSGEIISISDTYTEAEVYADELEHIS